MNANENTVISFIKSRIIIYERELMNALDRNDSAAAFQARAVQRELKVIVEAVLKNNIDLCNNALHSSFYITTKEAAELLGVYPTTVTRNAMNLRGQKTQKGWQFPRDFIISQIEFYKQKPKPGRKSSKK